MSVEMKEVKIHVPEPLSLVHELLKKNDKIEDLLSNKLKLNIDDKTLKIILEVFNVLLGKTVESSPLKSIIEGIKQCFADGKIDVNDIPIIVKVITDVMNLNKEQFTTVKPSFEHVGIVIKIIITVLSELNIIKNNDDELILRIVDSSLALLSTSIDLSKVNMKKIFCCC
jgi:hypothetical protein